MSVADEDIWGCMTPKPGSDAAIKKGCTCPILDNAKGKGLLYADGVCFYVNGDCRIHGEKELLLGVAIGKNLNNGQ